MVINNKKQKNKNRAKADNKCGVWWLNVELFLQTHTTDTTKSSVERIKPNRYYSFVHFRLETFQAAKEWKEITNISKLHII